MSGTALNPTVTGAPAPRFALAVTLAAGALAAYVCLSISTGTDYGLQLPVGPDNAAPAVNALAHMRISAALAQQPLMGLFSLLLRAPVAWLTSALGGGQMLVYRLGALVCMVPAALLAAWLAVSARAAGITVAGLAGAAVVLLGSPTVAAIGWGHPEEILAASLAAAALLSATRGHATAAGVLTGAAIGSKEWAVIAALPMLLALPRPARPRAALITACGALACVALPAGLDPDAFRRAGDALGGTHHVTALSGWWLLHGSSATLPLGLDKSAALLLGVAGALTLALFASRRERLKDPMALFCLLAIARCVLDPGPTEYYYVAAVIPLAAWEVSRLRRLPLASLVAVAMVRLSFGPAAHLGTGGMQALTLLWTLPMIAYLLVHSVRGGVLRTTTGAV